MTCPACQAANPPAHLFCERCGTALVRPCPTCGASVGMDAQFCGLCGRRLPRDGLPARPLLPPLYRVQMVALATARAWRSFGPHGWHVFALAGCVLIALLIRYRFWIFITDPDWFHRAGILHWPEPTLKNFIAVVILLLVMSFSAGHSGRTRDRQGGV